ncbi:hypothetical protein [Microbulbifer epialgicus]|uniref:OsmC-like protein n=1 Tax=Microbulbifer epialgicus TaxID=393907 RepID=A0ABV4P574_9GAMM
MRALVGIAGSPVQVRNTEAKGIKTKRSPFMQSELNVAGFAIIDASDIEAAITKVSHMPCTVAHGVIKTWPLETAGESRPVQHMEIL